MCLSCDISIGTMIDMMTRSENMANIRNKDTLPELKIRQALRLARIGYRKNVKTLPGTPDIVCSRYKTAIFINGCFWHRHEGCKYATTPKTRQDYWTEKFRRNIERDIENKEDLTSLGWNVVVVWECEVRSRTTEDLSQYFTVLLNTNNRMAEQGD